MMELLLGGAVTAALSVAYLLWRERDRRAAAEQSLANHRDFLDKADGRVTALQVVVARKEKRIQELEKRLGAVNPRSLFDDVFGGSEPEPEK